MEPCEVNNTKTESFFESVDAVVVDIGWWTGTGDCVGPSSEVLRSLWVLDSITCVEWCKYLYTSVSNVKMQSSNRIDEV